MTWTFATPVLLDPYTTYGIDVGMTSSTSGWHTGIPYINVTADDYAGGTSYTSGASRHRHRLREFRHQLRPHLPPRHRAPARTRVFELVAPSPADNATDALATRELV